MTVQTFTTLGGTATDVKVAKIGHGLMTMTWVPTAVPDEICFESIKSGVDLLPPSVKMLINAGEFYAHDLGTANLEMISRFFEKYPEYAERTFLSVKGGMKVKELAPDCSTENLRRSLTTINATLRGKKRVDLFECARVDSNRPVEDVIRDLVVLLKEGLFDHIGMSECSAETLRRAHSVYPITAVEIEVSPWSYEEETKKVLAASQELDIAVAAYSPLGKGFLTGSIKSINDIPEGDHRRMLSRLSKEEHFNHNMAMVHGLKSIADKKGITSAALCLAWVGSLGPKVIPIPGSSHPDRTTVNTAAADVKLSDEEVKAIWAVMEGHEIKGGRSWDGVPDHVLHLWG